MLRSAITDTALVTGRNLRHFIRQPDLLSFSTIQPVLFVLLFVYVFGGAVSRCRTGRLRRLPAARDLRPVGAWHGPNHSPDNIFIHP